MIGRTLSHYRITAALGAGGMGEVYRATDTALGRDVAIKVLPAEVAHDPERLARFRCEAHLLASLNHPHIAAIYGLEEADGKPFLALELVEGEDLKQRLDRGAIPVEEALEIARQVAEALEDAHSKGIVHRDLKPANVKLTADGRVKVLDFGLAKAWAGNESGGSSGSAALSQSPTLARTGTVAGVILGTAAYMSPEQARGKPVDRRSDVWSFGVLLWEMLTGRALFAGDTVTDVIAAVVTREPDLDALPEATPPAGRWLAYMSGESGRYEVYVEPFRRDGDRVRVSVDGGGQPKWRADGKGLFLTAASRRLQAVEVRPAGDRLDVSLPADLFELRGFTQQYNDDYAPSADGRRFLVKLPVEQERKPQLQVVTSWTSLLEQPAR